ncbi:unnamed protein product [Urochloa humidicola]
MLYRSVANASRFVTVNSFLHARLSQVASGMEIDSNPASAAIRFPPPLFPVRLQPNLISSLSVDEPTAYWLIAALPRRRRRSSSLSYSPRSRSTPTSLSLRHRCSPCAAAPPAIFYLLSHLLNPHCRFTYAVLQIGCQPNQLLLLP